MILADVPPVSGDPSGDPAISNYVGNVDYSYTISSFSDLTNSVTSATQSIFPWLFVLPCSFLVFFLFRFVLRWLRRTVRGIVP